MHARLLADSGHGVRVRRLGGDRAGEMRLTRFLRNSAVTPEEMAATAGARLAARCQGRHVLAIQDTTVTRSAGGGGTYLHAVLGVDAADGAVLGLIGARFLVRTAGKKASRKATAIEAKESQRWLDGAAQAAGLCAGAARLTVIADRESDIFEAFVRRPASTDLLVRAAHDRSLEDGGRLFATVAAWPRQGYSDLALPAQPGRSARTARLALRFGRVRLQRPQGKLGDLPPQIEVSLIDLREEAPPAGVAPVHWRLIATEPVDGVAAALALADLYRRRWAIEQVFRTLKTKGFDVEGLLVEDEAPRQNLVMAALIAAVSIQQLVHARDGGPPATTLRPVTDAFDADDLPLLEAFTAELEGKTARQKNPHPKGSLAYAAWVCARLGGWTGYYGKPGPIVMLHGWFKFQAAKHGVRTFARYAHV